MPGQLEIESGSRICAQLLEVGNSRSALSAARSPASPRDSPFVQNLEPAMFRNQTNRDPARMSMAWLGFSVLLLMHLQAVSVAPIAAAFVLRPLTVHGDTQLDGGDGASQSQTGPTWLRSGSAGFCNISSAHTNRDPEFQKAQQSYFNSLRPDFSDNRAIILIPDRIALGDYKTQCEESSLIWCPSLEPTLFLTGFVSDIQNSTALVVAQIPLCFPAECCSAQTACCSSSPDLVDKWLDEFHLSLRLMCQDFPLLCAKDGYNTLVQDGRCKDSDTSVFTSKLVLGLLIGFLAACCCCTTAFFQRHKCKRLCSRCQPDKRSQSSPIIIVKTPSYYNAMFEDCAICVEDVPGKTITQLPCPGRHKFHLDCVNQWLHKNPTCPTCRHPVPPPPR